MPHDDAAATEIAEEGGVRAFRALVLALAGIPEGGRPDAREPRREPEKVVRMRMLEHDRTKGASPARRKNGGDDAVAHVDR